MGILILLLPVMFTCSMAKEMAEVPSPNSMGTCVRNYKKVGCHEAGEELTLRITDRDSSSKVFSGKWLRWGKLFGGDLHDLACRCHEKAKEEGSEYFAIEFWAECWTGNITKWTAKSTKCANKDFKTCVDADVDECSGKANTHYIYKANTEIIIVEPWTECSSTARNCKCSSSIGPCRCDVGYTGNGHNCTDIDECELGKSNCSAKATCRNTEGSFECDVKCDGISAKGGNNGDGCCKLPQTIPEGRYAACVTFGRSGVPWCATGDNYSEDKLWGNCEIPAGSEKWTDIVFAPASGMQVAYDQLVLSLQRLPKEFVLKTIIRFNEVTNAKEGIIDCMTSSGIRILSIYKDFTYSARILGFLVTLNGEPQTLEVRVNFETDKPLIVSVSQMLQGNSYELDITVDGVSHPTPNDGATSWGPIQCYAYKSTASKGIPGKIYQAKISVKGD